jgi:hypothetical protein
MPARASAARCLPHAGTALLDGTHGLRRSAQGGPGTETPCPPSPAPMLAVSRRHDAIDVFQSRADTAGRRAAGPGAPA